MTILPPDVDQRLQVVTPNPNSTAALRRRWTMLAKETGGADLHDALDVAAPLGQDQRVLHSASQRQRSVPLLRHLEGSGSCDLSPQVLPACLQAAEYGHRSRTVPRNQLCFVPPIRATSALEARVSLGRAKPAKLPATERY